MIQVIYFIMESEDYDDNYGFAFSQENISPSKTQNNARDGLKSQIFITAGKRSVACGEKTSTTRCLKGRTKKRTI